MFVSQMLRCNPMKHAQDQEPQGRVFLLLCQGPEPWAAQSGTQSLRRLQSWWPHGPLGSQLLEASGEATEMSSRGHRAVEVTVTGDGAEVMGVPAGMSVMVAEVGWAQPFR